MSQETTQGTAFSSLGNAANDFLEVYNTKALKATDDQIIKLYQDVKKLWDLGLEPDLFNTSNIIFDQEKGFTLIDISEISGRYESFEALWKDFISSVKSNIESYNDVDINVAKLLDNFSSKLIQVSKGLGDALTEGFRKGIDAHSNSKKAEKATDDFANGIVDETQERTGDVEEAGEDLGKSYAKGYQKGLAKGEGDSSNS